MLVQSAAIAAVDILAEDPSTAHVLVQLGALGILVDMQDVTVAPYSDPDRGNIAGHARLALSSLFVHERSIETAHHTMSGLLSMVKSNNTLLTGERKGRNRKFKAVGWVNALIAMDCLDLLKAGNAGRDEAVHVLSQVHLIEKGHKNDNKKAEASNNIFGAGPTAGVIGLTLNVIRKLIDKIVQGQQEDRSLEIYNGATATDCVRATLGILTELMEHGEEIATRDLIGYHGDVGFFDDLMEKVPALHGACKRIHQIVREYDILRRTAEKMRDRELAEAAIRIQVCIKNDEFVFKIEEFCIKNDELCIKMMNYAEFRATSAPGKPRDWKNKRRGKHSWRRNARRRRRRANAM